MFWTERLDAIGTEANEESEGLAVRVAVLADAGSSLDVAELTASWLYRIS
jgi:hypothetical protein